MTDETAGLSEAEIEALKDDDELDNTESEVQAEEEPEAKDDTDEEAEVAADEAGGTDDAAEDSAETVDGAGVTTSKGVDYTPQLAAQAVPEDIDEQITAVGTAMDALETKLSEGEIDHGEFIAENRKLGDQRADLKASKREAEFVEINNKAIADQVWNSDVSRFYDDNPTFKGAALNGALRGVLDTLYQDEAHNGKANRWFLEEAGRQVNDAFGIKGKAAQVVEEPVPAEEATAAKTAARTAKKSAKPVKTLAGAPEAEATTTSDDPFVALDNMGGMELEAKLSKMSKADADNYLNTRAMHG